MSNFIPISGLDELATISSDDFFAFVDSGSVTTYRGYVRTLKNFFAASGSVLSSSWATESISASHTIETDSASYLYPRLYEMTSSWSENLVWTSVAGTASLAYNAHTASRLEGVGSSYENSFSINNSLTIGDSAYLEIPVRTNITSAVGSLPSLKANSLFLNKDYTPLSGLGYGKAYYYDNISSNRGKLIFDLGDTYTQVDNIGPNVDWAQQQGRGFLFQTNEAGNVSLGMRTGSLLFISSSGRVFGRIFEANTFSSSKAGSSEVGFYGTASWAVMSNYALGTANVVPPGMIVAYAGSSPPSGWLNCDGTQYNPATYGALAALIGTNYGRALTVTVSTTYESTTTYHNANNGTLRITYVSGGSGVFSITWGASTYYINNQTANYVQFNGLDGPVTYNFTYTDYGISPSIGYAMSGYVGYGTGGTWSQTTTLNAATYRVPRMSSAYFLTYATISPLIWIIKT